MLVGLAMLPAEPASPCDGGRQTWIPVLDKDMTFRPRPQPGPGIPLGARSVGWYSVPAHWQDNVQEKPFVQVLWGLEGEGVVDLGQGPRALGPGEIAIYLPGMVHRIAAGARPWRYCWWTMDGPLAADLVRHAGLAARVQHAGPAPEARLRALRDAIADPSPVAERRAGAIAYELLVSIGAPPPERDAIAEHALQLVQARWADPAFGIAALAARCRAHRSSLSRRFARAHGMPPADYLADLRVRNALSLLHSTTLPVAEIARRCGFADPAYFARLVRRRTGRSPRVFRAGG